MKQIALTQGKFAEVDDEWHDYLMQWKWSAKCSKNGLVYYAQRGVWDGEKVNGIYMHSLIMWDNPLKLPVDHIDGNGLNDMYVNLRFCTNQENLMNRGSNKNSSSIYKGVSWDNTRQKWVAQISVNKMKIHLVRFENEIDAALQYDIWALDIYGKFARLNFPLCDHV